MKVSELSGEWRGNVGENKESGALETAVRLLCGTLRVRYAMLQLVFISMSISVARIL